MTTRKSFASLRSELLMTRSYFVDTEFPPNDNSLYMPGRPRGAYGRVVWKRPSEIADYPDFFCKDSQGQCLDQGNLGDCWFVAGAAILASSHRKQLERVVPRDQGFDRDYAGIFHFYFWWYGDFQEVIIDDYLPTDGSRLIFCSNKERVNEFWAALLEKAYAKLRGSYQALEGGKLQDSLVDFTGGISEPIDIRDKKNIPSNIYDTLLRSYRMNSMLGASIYRPSNAEEPVVRLYNGLYMGHAYSITGFKQMNFEGRLVQLVRMRNPWGRKEWNGPWSDRSREMATLPEAVRNELRFQALDDGVFWMSISDVLANFDEINMCHLQPDAVTDQVAMDEHKQHWNVKVYHDKWIRGVTAGGSLNPSTQNLYWKNPQFFVTLTDFDECLTEHDCTLIVSLMEKERGGDLAMSAIGFDVYKITTPDFRPLDGARASRNSLQLAKRSGTYQFYREVSRRFQLPFGQYVIIPSTFRPHEEREFLLRLFTEKKADSGVLDEVPVPSTPVSPVGDRLTEQFIVYAGEDGRMDARELSKFIKVMSKLDFREELNFGSEACRSMVTLADKSQSGFLVLEDLKTMWRDVKTYRDVFKRFDADRSGYVDTFELSSLFTTLGFPVNRAVLTSVVRRYGGRDNRITLEDFVIVICKLVLLNSIFVNQQRGRNNRDVAQFTRNEFLQYTMFC